MHPSHPPALPKLPLRPGPFRRILAMLVLCLLPAMARVQAQAQATPGGWWDAGIEALLAQAGTNRPALVQALLQAPEPQREGWRFLLENMPKPDLEAVPAALIATNVTLAYAAFDHAPWKEAVPRDLFLNDILPYASVNEQRDDWRQRLYSIAAPMVRGCKTPGEAAQKLNRELFPLLKVRYSTQRRRADQGPLETMASGMATCTGLSILLVDACRAVGIPARVVGVPLWANKRGNHTWVEIWDNGWHFTGAAEPDPNGLNKGWFVHDASQANKEIPEHAIYASSFRQTGLSFPMVWARSIQWVPAINVTDRYTPKPAATTTAAQPAASGPAPGSTNAFRLMVRVLDRPAGQRVAARVTVQGTGPGAVRLEGTSSDETADLNNILPFEVERERDYSIRVEHGSRILSRSYRSGTNTQEILLFCLDERPAFLPASMACAAPAPASQPLKPRDRQRLESALQAYFAAPEQARPTLPSALDRLLQRHEPDVRRVAWEQFLKSPAHAALKSDHQAGQVRFKEHRSPYILRTVGSKPAGGWPLFIAMHGGGGAPQEVNDRQWQIMQRYYRDHPELGGYLYLALRAPNNTWNGFYDNYVYPLIETLIRQLVVCEGADPAKVFLMGYSHGGYGAFAIGPKMPDRFAAIHASAAAPTDGETSARTLRNTLFTFMIGEKDTAHGRIDRCRKFDTTVQGLRASVGTGAPGAYPVFMQYIAGHGHGGLPDRDKITEMYAAVRNPAPPVLAWELTDPVIRDFYWLRVANPAKATTIDASCNGNTVVLQTSTDWKAGEITVKLDSRLVDMTRPVRVELNGVATSHRPRPSLRTLCEQLWLRGDADLAFTSEIRVAPPQTR